MPKELPVWERFLKQATDLLEVYAHADNHDNRVDYGFKKLYLEFLRKVNLNNPSTIPHDCPALITSDGDFGSLSGMDERQEALDQLIRRLQEELELPSPYYAVSMTDYAGRLESFMVEKGASSRIVGHLVLVMIARLSKINEEADKGIESKWKDWQDAQSQKPFLANQANREA
jgi:hypothetical protein